MFTLRSARNKYSRGVKVLAQRAYVEVTSYVWETPNRITSPAEATIVIRDDRETFYLTIPNDKLASVIERLQVIQQRNEREKAQRAANDQTFAALSQEAARLIREMKDQ